MKSTSLLLATLTSMALFASELPALVLPEGVGVNIHFTSGHQRDLDLIAAGGFKFIRMDFGWGGIERQKGEYDWSAYDALTSDLEKRGLRAIYILDYSNHLYEEAVPSRNPVNGREHRDTASPQHPESIAAFARWAAASARHFAGHRIVWEIWNEPNISFWKPKPNVEQYTALALAAAKAVREADPNATIIAPGTSQLPVKFIGSFLAAGALDNLDAVSFHPYRPYHKGPETALEDYAKLRELIERHAPTPAKKQLPIISSEWGYSTFMPKGVSPQKQAAYLARQQLINLFAGVPISIWYDWKDDGANPNEREENFGVVTHDLKPKPAYQALQTLARELSGFRIERRLETGATNDFVLRMRNGANQTKLAAWTAAEPHAATLTAHFDDFHRVAVAGGNPEAAKLTGGILSLELGEMPTCVTLLR